MSLLFLEKPAIRNVERDLDMSDEELESGWFLSFSSLWL